MSDHETPQAGWYPDPAGRHEQRYYEGTQWTDHVVDRGLTTQDPLEANASPTAQPAKVGDEAAASGMDHWWSRKPPEQRRPVLSSRLVLNMFEWRHPLKMLAATLVGIIVVGSVVTAVLVMAAGDDDQAAEITVTEGVFGVGDCFVSLVDGAPDLLAGVPEARVVDCALPHDGEVVAIDNGDSGFGFGYCPDAIRAYYDGARPAGTIPYTSQVSEPGRTLTICTTLASDLLTTGDGGATTEDDLSDDTEQPTSTPEPDESEEAGASVEPPGAGASMAGDTPCPPADGSAERTTSFSSPPPECLGRNVTYDAVFDTSEGRVRVRLDTERTPLTANNFAVLALFHYYDDTALFRTDVTIDIIQGGAPLTNTAGDPGPGYTIADEGSEYSYRPGQLVMARAGLPDSAGSQFFFTAGPDSALLDSIGDYVVFGEVMEGLDVLEAILALHTDDPGSPLGGYPARPVIVYSVTIEGR